MVRTFILNDGQRRAIERYLKERPSAMSSQIRQIRLRAKQLDFDVMDADMQLLRKLAVLVVPKGRKALDVKAVFNVRQTQSGDVKSSFEARPR